MEIDSEKQYQLYLRRFEEIFQAKQGSTESNEADLLAILIKDYEDKHYDISSTSRPV
jgi:HTH-type transcriptional regulator/antitoxin HigA